MNESSERAAEQPAPKKTRETVAAEFRSVLEQNGVNLAKLAEPLIKSSCRVDGEGNAHFSEELFIDLLHVLATSVCRHPIDIQVKTYGFERL